MVTTHLRCVQVTVFRNVGHGPVVGHQDISNRSQSYFEQIMCLAILQIYILHVCVLYAFIVVQ